MLAIECILKLWKVLDVWSTLVYLLHYILKCIHLDWRWLLGPFIYVLIQTLRLIVYIISIPDEELYSDTAVRCIASYVVKIIWCSRWLVPILGLCIALFAVAEGWLLLKIGWFFLFCHIQNDNRLILKKNVTPSYQAMLTDFWLFYYRILASTCFANFW